MLGIEFPPIYITTETCWLLEGVLSIDEPFLFYFVYCISKYSSIYINILMPILVNMCLKGIFLILL